jgi:hypothetical protein
VFVAVLALVVLAGAPVLAADEDTHEGLVVSAGAGKLVMTDKDGKNEHTHNVSPAARITCDGKECKLDDLKKGSKVKVTVKKQEGKDQVIKIEAKKPD